MGYIRKTPKDRPTRNCASCGKSFVIPAGVTKKKFCDVKCSGKMNEKRHGSDTKIPCLKCHASLLMTGAQSGRLLNWPKQRVSELRKKLGIKTLTNKEAAPKALKRQYDYRYKINPDEPWWGNKSAEELWMKQLKVKDFDWSSMVNGYMNLKNYHKTKVLKGRVIIHRTKEERRRIEREREKKRLKEDPSYRAVYNLRKRFRGIIKSCKTGEGISSSGLIGCKTIELRIHLEKQFKRGMTWDNYGTYWHVDHIIPCAKFNHLIESQRKQCWHWTNLQPLEAKKNMQKSDTITKPQLSLLLCT